METGREFELGTDGPRLILVGVDGSDTSIRAGAFAAGVARREGAELLVAFVTSAPPFAGAAPASTAGAPPFAGAAPAVLADVTAASHEDEVADMRQLAEAGAAYVGVQLRFRSAHGDPFTELCRIAEEERADAVVVGASASAGHRFVGSLAVRMVKAGRWPVTVVP